MAYNGYFGKSSLNSTIRQRCVLGRNSIPAISPKTCHRSTVVGARADICSNVLIGKLMGSKPYSDHIGIIMETILLMIRCPAFRTHNKPMNRLFCVVFFLFFSFLFNLYHTFIDILKDWSVITVGLLKVRSELLSWYIWYARW